VTLLQYLPAAPPRTPPKAQHSTVLHRTRLHSHEHIRTYPATTAPCLVTNCSDYVRIFSPKNQIKTRKPLSLCCLLNKFDNLTHLTIFHSVLAAANTYLHTSGTQDRSRGHQCSSHSQLSGIVIILRVARVIHSKSLTPCHFTLPTLPIHCIHFLFSFYYQIRRPPGTPLFSSLVFSAAFCRWAVTSVPHRASTPPTRFRPAWCQPPCLHSLSIHSPSTERVHALLPVALSPGLGWIISRPSEPKKFVHQS
jgi:hypothetical protein